VASKNNIEEKFKPLMVEWRDAEYDSYFVKNPNNRLEKLSLQQIREFVRNSPL
jgi:hypothetical protein